MSFGFTLIELLVVVLIIGILAAVAVPQYRKAVEKSRAAEGMALLRTVAEAEHAYYLANGEYTTNLDNLDVGFKTSTEVSRHKYADLNQFNLFLWLIPNHSLIYAQRKENTYANWYIYYNLIDHTLWCGAWQNDEKGLSLCKTLGKGEKVSCADVAAIKCYQIQ